VLSVFAGDGQERVLELKYASRVEDRRAGSVPGISAAHDGRRAEEGAPA